MDSGTMLTDKELGRLRSTQNEAEWDATCDAVKRARGGRYPPDWFVRVVLSGLMAEAAERWRASKLADQEVLPCDGLSDGAAAGRTETNLRNAAYDLAEALRAADAGHRGWGLCRADVALRVVVFREGTLWIAQALEKDINAQGTTAELAIASFERTLIGEIIADAKEGIEPLSTTLGAPPEFEPKFYAALPMAGAPFLVALPADVPAEVPRAWMLMARSVPEHAGA